MPWVEAPSAKNSEEVFAIWTIHGRHSKWRVSEMGGRIKVWWMGCGKK